MPDPVSEAARIFGERVRDRRLSVALSQEDIAHLAGMNVSNYGKIERGLGNPNFATIVRIASVLEVDPGAMIEGLSSRQLPPERRPYTASDFIRERSGRERHQR